MKLRQSFTAAALMLSLAALPAMAKGNGKAKGHGKHKSKTEQSRYYGGSTSSTRASQMFDRFDANRDGVITRNEFPADAYTFDRLDVNRDGVLTRSEVQQRAGDRRGLENELRALDRNRDGVVSRDEWRGDWATFDRLDRNRDGVLSQSDIDAARSGRYGQYGDQNRRFYGIDRNHDGVITRAEWPGNDVSFRNQDRNRDGVISGSEMQSGRSDRYDRRRDDDRDDD